MRGTWFPEINHPIPSRFVDGYHHVHREYSHFGVHHIFGQTI
jgi:hypothetical protein